MTPPRALAAGLVLTATAGFIDASGFIGLGGFYASFMSGNTTQFGVGLGLLRFSTLALPAGLVVLFFIGSYLGTLVAQSHPRWGQTATLALTLVGVLASFALATGGYSIAQAMLPLAGAAGAQNAVLPPAGAARLGATFVTGTLFAAGQDLARATSGAAPPWRWLQHLLVWAALCIGALFGAVAYTRWQSAALLAPAAVYLLMLLRSIAAAPR